MSFEYPNYHFERSIIIPEQTEGLLGHGKIFVHSLHPVFCLHISTLKNLEKIFYELAGVLDISVEDVCNLYDSDPVSLGDIQVEIWPGETLPRNWEAIQNSFRESNKLELFGEDLKPLLSSHYSFLLDQGESYVFRSTVLSSSVFLECLDWEVNRRASIYHEFRVRRKVYLNAEVWTQQLEAFLTATRSNYKEIAENYGMILKNREDGFEYFMQHFPGCIDELPETQILESLGIYPDFDTYEDLKKATNVIFLDSGQIFIVLRSKIAKRAVNKTLMTLEEVEDAIPSIVFGVGTINKYEAFSVPEMLSSFSDCFMNPGFFKPFNYVEEFSPSEVDTIRRLLWEYIPISKDAEELHRKIEHITEKKRNMDLNLRSLLLEYQKYDQEKKAELANLFKTMFEAGLYMRQWRGPPHPYPKKEKDTKYFADRLDESFRIEVSKQITTLHEYLVKNPNIANLATMSHDHGDVYRTNYNLMTEVKGIMDETNCIRMLSVPLIVSANYYARLLDLESVPTITPGDFDRII